MAQVDKFLVSDESINASIGVHRLSIHSINGVQFVTVPQGVSFDLSYLTSATSSADQTTYTFSSQSFGTADTDRYIVVGVGFVSRNEPQTISSVTIGGVAATALTARSEQDEGTWSSVAQFWIAAVPSGTTGDVVVALNAQASACGVGLWRLITDDITPHDTATDTADTISVNVNVQDGGGVCAIAMCRNGSTTTWTGVTEDFDTDAQTGEYFTGGSHTATSNETPRTVSGNNDGATASMAGCAVSFAAI